METIAWIMLDAKAAAVTLMFYSRHLNPHLLLFGKVNWEATLLELEEDEVGGRNS